MKTIYSYNLVVVLMMTITSYVNDHYLMMFVIMWYTVKNDL